MVVSCRCEDAGLSLEWALLVLINSLNRNISSLQA